MGKMREGNIDGMPSKGVGMTLIVFMQGPKRPNTFIKIQMGDAVVYTFLKEEYDIHPNTTKANTRWFHMNHTRTRLRIGVT